MPTIRRLGWALMAILSIAIAGYAVMLLFYPAVRPPFISSSPYPWAVLAHFVGGGASLALGPWQFLTGPRENLRALHRWSGRTYAVAVLVGGVSGLVMSTVAQGGWIGRTGFFSLAVAWLTTLVVAVRCAWRGDIETHRRWMLRNFSLTFAAVMLRIYLPLSAVVGIPFEVSYPVVAWMCWVPNLLIALLLTGRSRSRLALRTA